MVLLADIINCNQNFMLSLGVNIQNLQQSGLCIKLRKDIQIVTLHVKYYW